METTNHLSISTPTTIIIQPQLSEIDLKANKLVFRLGWKSFIFGAGAFLIHYISIEHLANFSPMNAGIISGFFLMIAGLTSIAAGYRKTSYRCFIHAQIWSFIVIILLAPGLIAVAIAALIMDRQDIHPTCELTASSSRVILFGNSLEVYPSNVPCIKTENIFNLIQLFNILQLVIGVICFFIHVALLSIQRKVIKQMKIHESDINKIIVYTETNTFDANHTTSYADAAPKYEDLPLTDTLSK